MEEAWHTVHTELPEVIETNLVTDLAIWSFADDGWSPNRLASLSLPAFTPPARLKSNSTEWDSFSNIRDAMRNAEETEWQTKKAEAERQYRAALHDALASLPAQALPDPNRKSQRTDIVGLFKRIANTDAAAHELYIVLTDLADTHYREMPGTRWIGCPARAIGWACG
jgi:hypothetical protein